MSPRRPEVAVPAKQPQDVTTLLGRIHAGNERAKSDLIDLVYNELRRIAEPMMRGERADHTLQATALVHESLMRLLKGDTLERVQDRALFFFAAARAMRQVLVDHARSRNAVKRHGPALRMPLDGVLRDLERQNVDVLALDEGLNELAEIDPRKHRAISLRFFAGLGSAEIAELLGVSETTVRDDLRVARAWLRGILSEDR